MFRTAICIAAICATTGCASRSGSASVKPTGPKGQAQRTAPADSLEDFMSKVRARSAMARPLTGRALTVEAQDAAITAALITVKAHPTAANHRAVAAQYLRHGIKDVAHEHFTAAVKLDAKDAASWDGLARIWRDWGFPHLALSDAYRAVYYAPDSPTVHNTLGTVLQTLGQRAAARAQFEQALAAARKSGHSAEIDREGVLLDPDAAQAGPAIPNGMYRCRVIKLGAKAAGNLDFVLVGIRQVFAAHEGRRTRVTAGSGRRGDGSVVVIWPAFRGRDRDSHRPAAENSSRMPRHSPC